ESTPGLGSMFEIQFPCVEEAYIEHEVLEKHSNSSNIHTQVQLLTSELESKNNSSKPKQSTRAIDKAKPILLVAEDNHDLRQFLATQFSDTYNVIEARDGNEALKNAIKWNPDVIVSDLMMPEMDGLELCASIK